MSKTRVFIYGSCVSRDTFEHLDPEQFELVQYVARQSALSATTRPVDMIAPPTLESRFQQRMITGDFGSSLRPLLAQHAAEIDVLLIDLTDERLGVYLLPDGTVVTRSVELIESGAESSLPQGAHHVAFGTQQHYEYWSGAIRALGDSIRQTVPRAAVALLDIPWAEWSESGQQTPDSFGIGAAQANPVFRSYVEVAAQALGAHVVTLDPSEVMSGPHHPWGDAPFHYAEKVYLEAVRRLTGAEGRVVWGPGGTPARGNPATSATPSRASLREPESTSGAGPTAPLERLHGGPSFIIAGTQRGGTKWLEKQLAAHPHVSVASGAASEFLCNSKRYTDPGHTEKYLKEINKDPNAHWRGERSERYFWHTVDRQFSPERDDAAAAIAALVASDAPILLTLRDPVSRAASSYWHHISAGKFGYSTSIFQSPAVTGVIDLGFYRRHYEHWAKTLGAHRLHVLLYDDLVKDPQAYLNQALGVLGIPDSDDYKRSLKLKTRENHKPWLKDMRKRNPISREELSIFLELYRDDIDFVENLLGRNLDDWRNLRKIAASINTQ